MEINELIRFFNFGNQVRLRYKSLNVRAEKVDLPIRFSWFALLQRYHDKLV